MHNRHARRRAKPAELLLVPMIDIFTVLVTFLLMTAVFSKITILQLDLPSAAGGKPTEPPFRLEVIVRQEGFELTNGTTRIAAIPKVAGEYDLKGLTELALELKREHPQVDNASVLMEPDVNYNNLIEAMDAIRSAEVPVTATATVADQGGSGQGSSGAQAAAAGSGNVPLTRLALFTKIAVGDAP
jgi:biopolymer transport protein ExbD